MITGLLQATWRGVPFFIRSEGMTEAGRRIILHDYPNSDKRYVEDLGEIPPTFRISAFVTGTDFADRARQLERALSEPGKGRLTMPTFGAVNIFALSYSKDASQQSVGEISFELKFVRGETLSGPVVAQDTTETVYAAGDAARVAIGEALEDKWIPPWDYATSYIAQFDLNAVINSVIPLDAIVSNVTDFTQAVGYIQLNAAAIVQTAVGLKTTLMTAFQTLSEGLSSGLGLTSLLDLIGFGDSGTDFADSTVYGGSPLWDDTTESRIDRNTNRNTLITTTRVCALVNAYEQSADKTYETVDDIEQTRTALESQYQQLMRVDTSDNTLIQSTPTVRTAVETVRLASLSVMADKEQTAYSTTAITASTPVSAFILAYQLYNDTDQALTLRALNPTQRSTAMVGSLTVLQS